jgi:hypothetical protein
MTSAAYSSASSRGSYPRALASAIQTQPPRVLAETPKATRNPGRSAVRHASKSRPASSGDSQVDSIRMFIGRGKQDRIRRQIASRPYL